MILSLLKKPKKRKSPKKPKKPRFNEKMRHIRLSLPETLVSQLDIEAERVGKTNMEVIIELLKGVFEEEEDATHKQR